MADARGFFTELRRRKVVQTAIVYAAFAWAAIEVITTVLPVFGGRETVVRILVGLILLGLPVAIVVSWMFDFTPGGLRRDEGETAAIAEPDSSGMRETAMVDRPPPSPATPLIGRTEEVAGIVELFRSGARVVTITGPGGTGKTRVAIAAAAELRASFPGGTAYVEVAAITDADAVVPAVATAIGVKEAGTRSLEDGIATVIGDRRVLLVLDNLEQVIDAGGALASLVLACPALHLLNTSRAPLRITAEVEFALHPLALPPAGTVPALEDLETFPAIELFSERTRRVRPRFRLTSDNAQAVLQICRRLDGMPLAIELAAARLRTLEPDALLSRLEHALDVLTTGSRDLPERQRTLRATIDWSHSLLDDVEQRLFRRLAVFASGWPHEAIARVCDGEDSGGPLDAFESLVEKGLVHAIGGTGRFGMYETIREYAAERLADSGEERSVRRRHADYHRAVVQRMYADFRHRAQLESMATGDAESANIEEALEHYAEAGSGGDAEAARDGLQMCGDLWIYWHVRGVHVRAREWSRRFLELPAGRPFDEARAAALLTASIASSSLGDVRVAIAEAEEAERLAREDDYALGCMIVISAGVSHLIAGDLAAAKTAITEAVRRGRLAAVPWELGIGLSFLGIVESAFGEAERAEPLFREALALQRDIGDHEGMGSTIGGLAALEAGAGNHERALELYREAHDAFQAIGDRPEQARILEAIAWTALALERTDEARENFAGALRAYEEIGSVRGTGIALLGLAATHAAAGRAERAVRISAAADWFSRQEGVAMDYAKTTAAPRYLDAVRDSLGPAAIERLETEGRAMSVREAVRYALAVGGEAAVPARS